ncbi:MAG: amidohydrolase, partial [Zetaproteobacteria bacterium]|nr:amidohydrolase [Flavobacteriales bacterium]
MKNLTCCLLIVFAFNTTLNAQKKLPNIKAQISKSIEKHQADLIKISDSIWGQAETALLETNSSKILADYAEKNGFKVERGVAGMPTAFVATFGSGKPVISVLGEFD